MRSDYKFEKVLDHLALILNSDDIDTDLHKLVTIEMTTNPDAIDMDYGELMHIIVLKLIDFYKDQDLERLWLDYLREGGGSSDQAA